MDYYVDFPNSTIVRGKIVDRPLKPFDKDVFWWDYVNGILYGASDAMEWVVINPNTGMEAVETQFSYIQAPAYPLVTIPDNGRVLTIRLLIDNEFDAVGAAITIGDDADVDRLMTAAENDPTTVNTYEVNPDQLYAGGSTIIKAYITGTGASQGVAKALIIYDKG